MKKIKCINAEGFSLITLNKVYDVVSESRDYYYIKNDGNVEKRYGKSRFKEVENTNSKAEIKQEAPKTKPKTEEKPKGVICKFGKGSLLIYNKVYYPKGLTADKGHYIIEINGKDETFVVGRFVPEQ